ncbi:MAG: tRNA uridine-5-carboxymethylaminomethyl(34) synthesis GTPase MnmE [Desulfovibrio sp.]|jgi:tRNA modification GTPase|nr:tRNA uridine-5-carboxymethylaminomethyl(34) synthesis GTPase MnmE [Desulfovibrio sp.]
MAHTAPLRTGDTIAAIATAQGPGAVGIVRVSGSDARALAEGLFRSSRPGFSGLKPYRLHHGTLVDASGRVLDEVLAAFMPGPASFTGEDVAELYCHGGPAVLRAVLDELLARGARLAGPGEFSFRAFTNGRLDLAQAEAIAETIAAPTRAALHLAQLKLSGALSERINAVREGLEGLRARLCLAVDFPDEDVECLPLEELRGQALAAREAVCALLSGVERARAWREGLLAVLAGRVNAGKSSLLNALVGRNRALVSAAPGTTRDYIEEQVELSGLLVRLVDTAGLRGADVADPVTDPVEAAGQDLAREFMARAEAVLYVLDASRPLCPEDRAALAELAPARALVVLNKSDLPACDGADGAAEAVEAMGLASVRVSAKSGAGLEELCALLRGRLAGAAGAGGEPDPDALAPNARQAGALSLARDELAALAEEAASGLPYDILGLRLDAACRALAELTGDIAPDDVLNAIFSKFCIGK